MTDIIGKQTLEIISSADKFNQWMFHTIEPFSKGKVLEIGSGIGNISSQFLKNNYSIMLSDFRPEYCEELKNKYSHYSNFLGVKRIDLVDPEFSKKYVDLLDSFDTVYALNVIEHIENDNLAIANCKKLLKRGGNLIILVPSYQNLFNNFDIELGHFRRYTISKLTKIFRFNNLGINHTQYFNFIGILGWYFNGNILKKKRIPAEQMKLYNNLVPIFKVLDKLIINKFGLSTVVVGSNNS
jgi:2-polyprenyl-3-methyl-5-hydroxy-6-metoxy-1,4-benzoquinol methylase